jgi:hypothetical protein
MRFEVRPGATHGLQVEVKRTAMDGLHLIEIRLPANQKMLKHIYRAELRLTQKGRTRLMVPTPLEARADHLRAEVWIRPADLPQATLAIRTGAGAPLAETVYAIDLGAFAAGKAP